jgi:hypothetical protein
MFKKSIFVFILILSAGSSFAQFKSNFQFKKVAVKDSILIDTLSLLPNTLKIYGAENRIDSSDFNINYATALLTWKKKPSLDSITLAYRTFPLLLTQKSFHKDPSIIELEIVNNQSFTYRPKAEENALFNFDGIEKSGSISRSIGFGNNQDLAVNSNMVLQLAGKLTNEIEFIAAISDDNLPIQPEGNTQQINDFDKVFIQFKRKGATLIAGDYELRRPDSYFMNYFKRTQGAFASNTFKDKKGFTHQTQVAGAVAKGRSARNVFDGIEGNQGPYRLTGNNGEQFIIILSGTERVYIDGRLLLRGQDNDYVVDYNTSELTFTTKRLISRYSRIVVEFEYSDKVFGRSLYYLNQEFKSERLKIGFNLYSEQDNPNRPFLQDLSQEQKDFLKGVGNNINEAVYPNIDSIAFNENEILYKKIDTLGFTDVYVYSGNPLLAKYRVGFSFVGANKGDYRIDVSSTANGRVYVFTAPAGGISQGDYAPVSLLVTPKKQQLVTLNAEYKLSKRSNLFTEMAMSNNDVNLFSDLQHNENKGMAYKMVFSNKGKISGNDSTGLKLNTTASYEFTNHNFKPLERYRPVEFDRDFNIRGTNLEESNEHWTTLSLQLYKTDFKQVTYRISSFIRSQDYNGLQQAINSRYQFKSFTFGYDGSLLNSKADSIEGNFLKQRITLIKDFRKIAVGTEFQQESNETQRLNTKQLTLQSFSFRQYDYFIRSKETAKTGFQFNYITRFDELPVNSKLEKFSQAQTFNGRLELNKNGKSPLTINATYRNIDYLQTDSINKNEETLLGRIDYNLNAWNGFLNLSTFYELGTGQEPKREFIYLEVQAGQGIYAWNDYNSNGIKELNEFEISRFPDQARYIRIFRPNNEFIRSNFTNINQTLRLNPASILKQKTGFYSLIAKFSTISVLRIDKKVFAGEGGFLLNPYQTQLDERNLVSLNSFLRNTVFFNRANPVWGLDYNIQKNSSKASLTNGFDKRDLGEQGLRLRWNFIRKSNFIAEIKHGNKDFTSEIFSERNYQIAFIEFKPEFGYQFTTDFKVTFIAGIKQQKNKADLGGEETVNSRLGSELRYNLLKKGTFSTQLNFINNKFDGNNNTAIAYELLDGLQPGSNMTWSAGFQRTISNGIQLNFTYEGRKSNEVKTIHTGGLQVRAFF